MWIFNGGYVDRYLSRLCTLMDDIRLRFFGEQPNIHIFSTLIQIILSNINNYFYYELLL